MEKKSYVKPKLNSEEFVPQSYVAACYDFTATLTCAIPGSSSHSVGDGTTARDNHGICGNAGTFKVSGGSGYETNDNGTTNILRPITNLVIGAEASSNNGFSTSIGSNNGLENGKCYYATWTSEDKEHNTGFYNHYGKACVTGVVDVTGRPNHS